MKTKPLLAAAALAGLVAGCATHKPADAGKPACKSAVEKGSCSGKSGCPSCGAKNGCPSKKAN